MGTRGMEHNYDHVFCCRALALAGSGPANQLGGKANTKSALGSYWGGEWQTLNQYQYLT